MSQTVPSRVVTAQSGRYSTGAKREYWYETVAVAVGGRGVGVAGGRVAVAVAGRLVGAGGIGVCVAVDVATRVGVSVGSGVAVGDGSTSTVGVAVHVAVADGLGVLVGVGVTVGVRATKESRGQVQLMVANMVAVMMPKTASLTLVRSTSAWPAVRLLPFDGMSTNLPCILSLRLDQLQTGCLHYLLDTNMMLVDWPASLQLTMSTWSCSDRGTGLPRLSTMSRMKA